MARLWGNGDNGTVKNGEIVQNCPIFLRFSSDFLSISHLVLYISQFFLAIPDNSPFPPILPHFPSFPPITPHFPHFFKSLWLGGYFGCH